MNRYRSLAALAAFSMLPLAACSKSEPPAPSAPTPAAIALRVTTIDVGRSLSADKTISDKTDSFTPTDIFYVSIRTEGTSPSATLDARWTYQDGQQVSTATQTVQLTGSDWTEFHAAKPDGWPAGRYQVEVRLNGSTAGTHEFEVK